MKNKKGFSLIEIVVVLMILAILAAITWPTLSQYFQDSSEEIYIAEGEKILTSCQVEAQKYVSKHASLSEHTLNDRSAQILKRTSLSGKIISVYSNDTNKDVGFFCYQVEDGSCYVIYENEELYISKTEVDYIDSLAPRVRDGVFEMFDTIFSEYFNTRTKASLDSTGPNFGIKYAAALKDMGIDIDSCYFRIYYDKNNRNYTLSITNVPLSTDMKGQRVQLVQYKFVEGFDKPVVDQYVGSAEVKTRKENQASTGKDVEYAYIDGSSMQLELEKKGIEFSNK